MMRIFDIETDGLNATKIHCLVWCDLEGNFHELTKEQEYRDFFRESNTLIGHNIIRYDIPTVERLLGIKVDCELVDTLPLSWYINFDRPKHGLETYGFDFQIPKPKVEDWENQPVEVYLHRCKEDVRINTRLWASLNKKLDALYDDEEQKWRLIRYLSFKMDCAREQEEIGWRLDVERAENLLEQLQAQQSVKVEQLKEVMPKRVLTKRVNKPRNTHRKDGTLSVNGEKWFRALRELKMPLDTEDFVVVPCGEEPGNPNSTEQVKAWLYSLGWKPETFNYIRNKQTGEERKVEQIRDNGELCQSVIKLKEKNPSVEILEGLSILQHRIGIVKGFIESYEGGYLKAQIEGLTNTFRFKHRKPLVNLPGVDKPWGKEIRGLLCSPGEDQVLMGCDMVSLEDTTKRHYMKPLDPDYVEEMSKEGYDPHLDLAVTAGALTPQQVESHKNGTQNWSHTRKKFKAVNYSAVYGVGKYKLSRELHCSVDEAEQLLEAYWKRNWSVRRIAERQFVKEANGNTWLRNPVSGFFHHLRFDKDRFSTLNQSTGVYCFDLWVNRVRAQGVKVCGQFHDEIIAPTLKVDQPAVENALTAAIKDVNRRLNLNVELKIDYKTGTNYAEIH